MLNLFADCMILASRLPKSDVAARMARNHRREDEEWLMQRRMNRFHAAQS